MTELQRKVLNHVCDYLGVDPDSVFTSSRKRNTVLAKHVCMYVFKKKFGHSHEDVGKLFPREGKPMDHTSVMHAYKTIQDSLDVKDESVCDPVNVAMNYVDTHFSYGETSHLNNVMLISFHKDFEVDKLLKLIKRNYPTVQINVA